MAYKNKAQLKRARGFTDDSTEKIIRNADDLRVSRGFKARPAKGVEINPYSSSQFGKEEVPSVAKSRYNSIPLSLGNKQETQIQPEPTPLAKDIEGPFIAPYSRPEFAPKERQYSEENKTMGPQPYVMPEDVKRRFERNKQIDEYFADKSEFLGYVTAPSEIKEMVKERNKERQKELLRDKRVRETTLGRGFASGLTLGASDYIPRTEEQEEGLRKYPELDVAGRVGGYVAPGTVASRISGYVGKSILSKIAGEGLKQGAIQVGKKELLKQAGRTGLKWGVQEGAAGLGMGATESLIRGETKEEALDRASTYGLYGLAGGSVLGSLSQLGTDLIQLRNFNKSKVVEDMINYQKDFGNSYNKVKQSGNMQAYDDLIRSNQDAIEGLKSNKKFGTGKESNKAIQTLEEVTNALRKERANLIEGRLPQAKIEGVRPPTQQSVQSKIGTGPITTSASQTQAFRGAMTEQPLIGRELPPVESLRPQAIGDKLGLPRPESMVPTSMSGAKPTTQESLQVQNAIGDRTFESVGKRNVKAYQQENEAIKPYYKTLANYILQEEFVPAKRGLSGDYTRSVQGEVMKKLKETGLKQSEIKEGLELIIKDGGLENVAKAKRIELVLDDLYSNGFTTIDGYPLDPEQGYLDIKSKFDGRQYEMPTKVDEILPMPEVKKPKAYKQPERLGFTEQATATQVQPPKVTPPKKTPSEGKLGFSGPSQTKQYYPKSTGLGDKAKALSPSQMVQNFTDRFNDVFVRKGKMKQGTLGDFNTRTYVTRMKKSNDIPTLLHELAHYYDVKNNLIKNMSPSQLIELSSQFTDTQSQKMDLNTKAQESFAETIRSYMVGEIDKTHPTFKKFVEPNIKVEDMKFMDEMKDGITNFVNLKPEEQIRKTVYAESDIKPKDKFSFRDVGEKLYTQFVDQHRPVARTARELGGAKGEQNIKEYLAQLRGYKSTAEFNINPSMTKGKYQSDLYGNNIGKSLSDIVRPLVEKGKDVEDKFWRVYAVSRRAMDYKKRGLDMPLPYDVYEDALKQLDIENPEFKKIFDDVLKFKKNLMQLLVDSGLKTQKQVNDILEANPNHIHLFRVMKDSDSIGVSSKIGSNKNPIKRVTGSGLDIVDPYESLIKMTYLYWNIARRQEVMTQLVELEGKSKGKGLWMSKADNKFQPKKLNDDEVIKVVKTYFDNLFENSGISEVELEGIKSDIDMSKSELGNLGQTLFNITSRANNNQVTVYNNGKPVVYDINPELHKAIVQSDPVVSNTAINILTKIGDFQAKTIMIKPTFPVWTAIREIGTDLLVTRAGITPLDIMKSYIDVLGGNALWREYEKRGGTNTVYFGKDGIFEKETIQQIRASKKKLDRFKYRLKRPFDTTMDILTILDVSPKLAEFTRDLENKGLVKRGFTDVIKEAYKNRTSSKISDEFIQMQADLQGVSAKEYRQAIEKARDISFDVSKKGSTMQKYQLNRMWRFSNAALQGATNFFRKLAFNKDSRKNFVIRGTLMIMGSVGLYMLLRKNDYYQDMPDWKKDGFWWIPIGDPDTTKNFVAVPKPFQEALLTSTIPERIMRRMEDDKYISDRAFEGLVETTKGTFFPSSTPIFASPLFENLMNEQWNGIPVESASDVYRRPEDRYNEYTSQTSIGISQLTKDIKYMPEMLKSPKQIDNLIYGYTNSPGSTALTTIDAILGKKQPKDILMTSGIANLGVRDVSKSSKAVNEFYEDRGQLMEDLNSIKFQVEEGKQVNVEKLKKYIVGKEMLEKYNEANKSLTQLRNLKKAATKNKDPQLEDRIQKKIVQLAKIINGFSDLIEERLNNNN